MQFNKGFIDKFKGVLAEISETEIAGFELELTGWRCSVIYLGKLSSLQIAAQFDFAQNFDWLGKIVSIW